MFEPFPKLTRFSHDWTVTEKIDGTNAQILIMTAADWLAAGSDIEPLVGGGRAILPGSEPEEFVIFAGSRNRMLTAENDNYGFAKWVQRNANELLSLGTGRHFGEWCGLGINRNYGLKEKRFVLFNAARWTNNPDLPACVDVVPVLFRGYAGSSNEFQLCLERLERNGSAFAPGFMKPEGIVMFHRPSGSLFKKTFDYDEEGKWAEKVAA